MKKTLCNHFLACCIAVVLAVLTLASCSKGPDYGELIPSDAIAVTALDLGTLWEKGEVDNIEQLSFAKLGLQQLRSDDPQMAAIVDAILKDPRSTGLDLKGDVVVYLGMDDNSDLAGALMAGVQNRKKFEEFLSQLCSNNDLTLSTEERKGWHVMTMESEYGIRNACIVNNKVAVLLFSEDMLDGIMELTHSESLASNRNFRQYWKDRSEVSVWMNTGSIMEIAEGFGEDIKGTIGRIYGEKFWDEIERSGIAANITFDKGVMRTVMTYQGISNKTIKTYMQKFNGDLVDLMPAKTYATLSTAYNLKETMKILAADEELGFDLDEEVADGITLGDAVNAFGGSLIFSLFDFEVNEGSVMPMMAVAVDIKDADIVRSLLKEAELTETDKDVYAIEGILDTPIYIALNKKALFVTNSDKALEGFKNGKVKGALGSVAKSAREGNYLYADLDINHYPDGIRALLPESVVNLMGKYFDYAEFKTNDTKSGECDLFIKDKKQNSLLATLHFVDDNLVELGKLFDEIGGGEECPVYEEEYYVDDEDMELLDEDIHIQ